MKKGNQRIVHMERRLDKKQGTARGMQQLELDACGGGVRGSGAAGTELIGVTAVGRSQEVRGGLDGRLAPGEGRVCECVDIVCSCMHILTCVHICVYVFAHTDRHRHRNTRTHTRMHARAHTHTHTHSKPSLFLSLSHPLCLALALARARTHTHTVSVSLALHRPPTMFLFPT